MPLDDSSLAILKVMKGAYRFTPAIDGRSVDARRTDRPSALQKAALLNRMVVLRPIEGWFPSGGLGIVYGVILAIGSLAFGSCAVALRRLTRYE
jgi:hypothetical protein